MKKLIALALILIAFTTEGQIYTPVNNYYQWLGGKFKNTLILPSRDTSWVPDGAALTYWPGHGYYKRNVDASKWELFALLQETDPVFGASPAATITSGMINSWNNKVNKVATIVYADDFTDSFTGFDASTGLNNGSAIVQAINALPSSGGTIMLSKKTYYPTGYGNGHTLQKGSVRLIGAGSPWYNFDCTGLVGGTVIQGTLNVWADGFEIRDLGIDCGYNVTTTYYSGNAQDAFAFALSPYPDNTTYRNGFVANNIVTLVKSPTDLYHAFLVERANGAKIDNITTMFGVHGFAYKSKNGQIGRITAYANGSDNIVIKADFLASTINNQFSELVAMDMPAGTAPYVTIPNTAIGVYFLGDTDGVTGLGSTQVGSIKAQNIFIAVQITGNFPSSDLHVNSVDVENCDYALYTYGPASFNRIAFDNYKLTNCDNGLHIGHQLGKSLYFGNIQHENASTPMSYLFEISNHDTVWVNSVQADNVTTVYNVYDNAYLQIGSERFRNCNKINGTNIYPVYNTRANQWYEAPPYGSIIVDSGKSNIEGINLLKSRVSLLANMTTRDNGLFRYQPDRWVLRFDSSDNMYLREPASGTTADSFLVRNQATGQVKKRSYSDVLINPSFTPQFKNYVSWAADAAHWYMFNGSGIPQWSWGLSGGSLWLASYDASGNNTGFPFWVNKSNSNFGFNTTSPARTVDVNGTTRSAHYEGRGSSPTITNTNTGVVGTGGTVTISGTDNCFVITVTTGTGALTPGTLCNITLAAPFTTAAVPVISPGGTGSGIANPWISPPTNQTITIGVDNAMANSTTYKFNVLIHGY